MSAFQKFFGCDTLAGPGNATSPVSSLEGKHVLIYFSAHWCPPCRQFTPMLAKWYKEFTAKRTDVELVFVSSDKDEGQFKEYFAEMPWLALPYEHRSQKNAISSAMGVSGIPSLIVLDPQAEVVTKKGRDGVMQDPSGANFPWKPKSFAEIMTGLEITRKDGTVTSYTDLAAKYPQLAFYFSAHWCPPCKAFTPKLASTYQTMMSRGVETEFIFVSSDREQSQYNEYRAEMPWAALGFQKGRELGEHFEIEGIPTLITIDTKTNKVLSSSCVEEVAEDEEGKNFPWVPTPLPLCSNMNPSGKVLEAINTQPCCVLFDKTGSVDTGAFAAAATAYDAGAKQKCTFLIANKGEQLELFGRIAQFLSLPAKDTMVVCFQISKNKAHMVFDADMSKVEENVKTFFVSIA